MNAPLRILHVIPSVGPQRGGPSALIRVIARGLVGAGLEVHVVTTDDDGAARLDVPLDAPIEKEGVTYRYFPRQLRFYTVSLPLATWLRHHVSSYDVLHIHALFSFSSFVAGRAASRSRVPFVVRPLGTLTPWGVQNLHPVLKTISLRLVERPLLARASAIHFTSETELRDARRVVRIDRPVVIPNAVDPSSIMTTPTLDQRRAGNTILCLTRFDQRKGIELLLEAFTHAREQIPALQLIVAGTGPEPYVVRLKDHATSLGVGEAVSWPGFVEGQKKRDLLNSADVFVLASESESFGLAVLEALAAGLPCVVTPGVAIGSNLQAAGAGIVAGATGEELSRALVDLFQDDQRRADASHNAARLAASEFSIESVAMRLKALYEQLSSR